METISSPEIAFPEQKTVRSAASRCAFAVLLFHLLAVATSYPIEIVLSFFVHSPEDLGWLRDLEQIIGQLSMMLGMFLTWFFLLRNMPKQDPAPARDPLSIRRLAFYLPCAVLMMYAGGLIAKIPSYFNVPLYSAESEAMRGTSRWVDILCAVFLAPVAEELFYRKLLLDRLSGFHPMTAILFAALLFGLAHGNLKQFQYAFLTGILFGIIYYRTQNILYTILLHASVNALFGELPLLLGGLANGWVLRGLYILLSLIGLFILIRYRRQFLPIPSEHPHYGKAFFSNAGWIACCVLFGSTMVFLEISNLR